MTIFFRLIYFTCVCYGSQTNTPSFILYSDLYCLPLRELAQVYGELDSAAQLWPGALEVGRGSVFNSFSEVWVCLLWKEKIQISPKVDQTWPDQMIHLYSKLSSSCENAGMCEISYLLNNLDRVVAKALNSQKQTANEVYFLFCRVFWTIVPLEGPCLLVLARWFLFLKDPHS